MEYSEKLKSPRWQRKRLEVLNRDNFTCCKCRDKETELHVHHLKYFKEPYDAPLEYLQTLCSNCHYYITFLHNDILESYSIDCNEKFIIHKILNSFIVEFKNIICVFIIDGKNYIFHSTFNKNSEVLRKIVSLIK